MKHTNCIWKRSLCILLMFCVITSSLLTPGLVRAEDTGAVLWVDPVNGNDANSGLTESAALKTIQTAAPIASQMSESSDVTVYLKGGTYAYGETIVFGAAESGKNGNSITYKSAAGETAIISGGSRLDGWTLHDAQKNIYVTDIPEGTELTRQFYVDGQPMPNASIETSPTDWLLLSSSGYMSPHVTSADTNEYMILDLGEDKQVSSVALYSGTEPDANGTAAGFPKDFTISTSADGMNWTVQVSETDFAAPNTNGKVEFEFNSVTTRYIKLDVTELGNPERLNPNKFNLALAEIMVGLKSDGTTDLNKVQHLDLTNNLITDTNVNVGYYGGGIARNTFTTHLHSATPVGNLVDGNKNTYVSTAAQIEAWLYPNGGNTQAYMIDVSKVVDGKNRGVSVGAVYLAVRENLIGAPIDFEIQISGDGNNNIWTTVVAEENFDWTEIGYEKLFTFNPVDAKYIRILAHETVSQDSYYHLQFTEAAIYKPADVALGATIEAPNNDVPATGWGKDYLANGTFDGTYTSSSTNSSTALNAPVTVDMHEVKAISGVRLYPRYKGSEAIQYIVAVRIFVSEDGLSYNKVLELTDINQPTSGAQLFVFPETVNARYVMIEPLEVIAGSTETNYRFQLSEIEIAPARVVPEEDSPELELKTEISYNELPLTAEDVIQFGHMADNSYVYSNTMSAAVDGNDTTVALTNAYQYQWLPSYGGSLVIPIVLNTTDDAGEPSLVGSVRLAVRSEGLCAPVDFDIDVADAEDNWTTVLTVDDEYWTDTLVKTFTFDPTVAYKLRVVARNMNPENSSTTWEQVEANHAIATRFGVAEIDVYSVEYVLAQSKLDLSAEDVLRYENASASDWNVPGGGTSNPASGAASTNPQAIVDGDYSTYAQMNQGLMIDWTGAYIPCVDLDVTNDDGSANIINRIDLYVREDLRSAPVTFTIQGKNSAGVWVDIQEVNNHLWTDGNSLSLTFDPVTVTQIRLVSFAWHPNIGTALYPDAGTGANCIGQMNICEMEVYSAEIEDQLPEVDEDSNLDSSNPIPSGLITQGDATVVGDSYVVTDVTVKNDNPVIEFKANKAIDGNVTPTTNYGYIVPECYDLSNIGNPEHLEMHYLSLWYHLFSYATGVSGDGTEIYCNTFGQRPTWIANAYEFIDSTGEWYIDRYEGKIYYKAADTMEDVEAILPVAEQVVYMEGASNITFDDVVFEHTTYTLPSRIGYSDAQANTQSYNGWTQVNGGVMMDSCENITITNSVIRNMGTVGIKVRSKTSVSDNVQITNNQIYDISYSGIIIGEVYKHNGYESWQLVTNTVIRNNYVTRVGIDIFDSPAITATYTNGTVIDHNEVSFCPYTGISTGWGWDDEVEKTTGNALEEVGNLQITNNFVHDVMKTNRDGGAIYNLGTAKDSVISGNYMYNSWDGDDNLERGIYMDEGSSYFEVYDNVIGAQAHYWLDMRNSSMKENYCHDNFYDADIIIRSNGADCTVEDNIAVEDGNFEDYSEAVEIIDNAGLLTPELKQGVENGFAPEHDINQEMYPGLNSRYIETVWGWQNVAVEGQSSITVYESAQKKITIYMPAGTDVTNLALLFDLEEGFTCDVTSGTARDFTNPVTYTLTNDETTVIWTVNVKAEHASGDDIVGTDVTLDEAIQNYAAEDWTKVPSASTEESLTFNTYSGYIGERFGTDTILHFDMTSSLNDGAKDWLQISLRNQDPYKMCINGNTEYNIGFNNDNLEVQKFVNGERTVLYGVIENYESIFGSLPNDYYTPDERHSITVGAINVDEGVRLFLYIDGNLVFDIIDADNPITNDGFFAVYGMTHPIILSTFTDIQNTPDASA